MFAIVSNLVNLVAKFVGTTEKMTGTIQLAIAVDMNF